MSLTIDLTQRRALITGVSSGIGAAIAEMLAKAGCDVAGCGSRPVEDAGASNFLATVRAHGRKAHYHSVNLATESGPAECVATAAEALGGIDLVVSNAGRNIFKGAENCTETDWEECMNLDLASHWRLARAAKPQAHSASISTPVRPVQVTSDTTSYPSSVGRTSTSTRVRARG